MHLYFKIHVAGEMYKVFLIVYINSLSKSNINNVISLKCGIVLTIRFKSFIPDDHLSYNKMYVRRTRIFFL